MCNRVVSREFNPVYLCIYLWPLSNLFDCISKVGEASQHGDFYVSKFA